MKNNKSWFSLPLAMGIVIIISLLASSILEYIIPFWKDIKWVENASNAYYLANSWIEEGLYNVYVRNNSWIIDNKTEYSDIDFSWNINSKYNTSSSWTILPPEWEWNSEYDKDWNIISSWKPIQLSIWNWDFNYNFDDLEIMFRIPDLNKDWDNNDLSLSWGTLAIVNWQLSANNNILNASWSIIKADQIDWNMLTLDNFQWIDLNWNETSDQIFDRFYEDNCDETNSWCILKFSIVNKLETDDIIDSIIVPYLEWKLTIWSSIIPLRYSKIESSGKSYGYKKNLEVKVAGNTVNEAFDFTVFQ